MHYSIGSITLNSKIIFFAKLPFGGEMIAETPEQYWQIIREIEKQYREHHEGKQTDLSKSASLVVAFTAAIAEGVWKAAFAFEDADLLSVKVEDLMFGGESYELASIAEVEAIIAVRKPVPPQQPSSS